MSAPVIRKEFWDINRHLLNVEVSGKLSFTEEGARQYRPMLARHGFNLANITRLADLRRVMRDVEALQREENPTVLRARLRHPHTTQVERVALANVLGGASFGERQRAAMPGTNVVSMALWRRRP